MIRDYYITKVFVPGWSLGIIFLSLIFMSGCKQAIPTENEILISETGRHNDFPVSAGGINPVICLSTDDFPGIRIVADLFGKDIEMVTGIKPEIVTDCKPDSGNVIIIGSIEKSPMIRDLSESGMLDISEVEGRWESCLIRTVKHPFPGVEQALVIAGSDKRGTIYGMFELSSAMGVSPWYWWADVPVQKKEALYLRTKKYILHEPAVKYRGIFINDEAPALSGWAFEKFGGFNSKFYEHVFELILRMKGNFLWPAMWGRAFYDDDPGNPALADLYGIVIGTSHHEPMMRAHDEWRRYGSGPWNYEKNEEELKSFWREGMQRKGNYESLVTVGMRGDGDEPMTQGTAIELLERIVSDQRKIIEEVTGKPASETPQVWALYKEVQEYYDKGMRVPDDVTLLLCDDNWGNIRRLPNLDDAPRPGGYGIYYHFDYVGGPRNYKWLNTNQIERVWEQMHLAFDQGVNRLWIVNVGDIKPMELPTQFFLDYAWDPGKWPAGKLTDYYIRWAEQQFGKEYAEDIAGILARYTKFNARRKPELLSPDTYSLVNFREAERIVGSYNRLAAEADSIYNSMDEPYRDAFYQLVLFPVKACANLNELYVTAGLNKLYAAQNRSTANDLAGRVKELFAYDSALTRYFHTELADGKWNHMMSQTHIGYTYWQQPDHNNMPYLLYVDPPAKPGMGVAVEGSEDYWPGNDSIPLTLAFDNIGSREHYLEIFNTGSKPFNFLLEPSDPWIEISKLQGEIRKEERIQVVIRCDRLAPGNHEGKIVIRGPDGSAAIVLVKLSCHDIEKEGIEGFVETDGYISMEAENFTSKQENDSVHWLKIPNLGRTSSGLTPTPVTATSVTPGQGTPYLSYRVHLFSEGDIKVNAYLSPTLNFPGKDGLKFGVSFDDGSVTIMNMHQRDNPWTWNQWVSNNINVVSGDFRIPEPGNHLLKFWMVDPAVVLQKIVIETGRKRESYLGPPESDYLTKIK